MARYFGWLEAGLRPKPQEAINGEIKASGDGLQETRRTGRVGVVVDLDLARDWPGILVGWTMDSDLDFEQR